MKHLDVSRTAKEVAMDRKEFDAALRAMIATPPISASEVSREIKKRARAIRQARPKAQRPQ